MKPLAHVTRYLNKELPYVSKLPVLGKGAFSIVYADGPDKVIKVSMCNAYREFVNFMPETEYDCPIQMPEVHDVEHLTVLPIRHAHLDEELDLRITLYRMKRYNSFALHKASPAANHAVRMYKELLRKQFNFAHADVTKGYEWLDNELNKLHDAYPYFVELMRDLNSLSRTTDKQFDMYKRTNFGMDSEGNTILLDPLFDSRFYNKLSL